MDNFESYYDILEIPKTANQDEIKKTFHKLANEYHPDRNSGATDKVKRLGEEKLKQINEAFNILNDVNKRKQYDTKIKEFEEKKQQAKQSQSSNTNNTHSTSSASSRSYTSSNSTSRASHTNYTSYKNPNNQSSSVSQKRPSKKITGTQIFWIIVVIVILIAAFNGINNNNTSNVNNAISNTQNPFSNSNFYPSTSNSAQVAPTNQTTTAAPSIGTLPTLVGQCDNTTVSNIGYRLDGSPSSGSWIAYADGISQVSYETIQGITDSQVGDKINLCLVSIPTNCPPGDNRGRVYQATNFRTGESWTAQDSEHSCGGA